MDPKKIAPTPPASKIPKAEESRLGFWITVHKIELRRGGIFTLSLVGGALLVYGIVGLINYYGFELPRARRAEAELGRSSIPIEVLRSQAPKPLEVGSVQVFSTGSKRDALARITNPNARLVAEFDYAFGIGDAPGEVRRTFLLPGESRPVIGLGISGDGSRNARLALTNLTWTRLRPHDVNDPKAFIDARIQFRVVSEDYQAALALDATQIARFTAKIANDSGFGYWRAGFIILLERAGQVVGVGETAIDRFASGEERTLEATWIPSPGAADKIEVIPVVHVFDASMFLPPPS